LAFWERLKAGKHDPRGIAMRMRLTASRPVILFFAIFTAAVIGPLLQPATAFSMKTGQTSQAEAAEFGFLRQAKVTCATVREGTQNITYSCPDGHTCFNSGGWKCRPPGAGPRSCSTCYNNQARDSNSCMSSGNDMTKSACVNRVNGELMKCLGNCS